MNYNLKSLENLNRCGSSINNWAVALHGIFPQYIQKKVEFGNKYHLEIIWNNRTYKVYCTNSPAFINENLSTLIESGIAYNTIIMDCSGTDKDKIKLYSLANKDNPSLHHILIKEDEKYIYDDKILNIPTGKIFDNTIRYFRQISLEALYKKEFKTYRPAKVKGGKQGHKILCQFDNVEKGYTEETKTIVDCYKIAVAHYGFKGSVRTFGRKLAAEKTMVLDDTRAGHLGNLTLVFDHNYKIYNNKGNTDSIDFINENGFNSYGQEPKDNNTISASPPVANSGNKKLIIEYEEFCTRIPEESKFTFEEYCELRNAS